MTRDARDRDRLLDAWALFAAAAMVTASLLALAAGAVATGTGTGFAAPVVVRLLVGHVFFSLVVAATSFAAVLWIHSARLLEGSRFSNRSGWIGWWLAAAGALLAMVGTLGPWGTPVLTEFVPVIVDPLFLSGFGLFMAGIALTTGAFGAAVAGAEIGRMPLVVYGMACSAGMMVATGLAGVASLTRLFGDWLAFRLAWRTPVVLFQAIFWGPAHLIQFAVIAAMVSAWILMLPGRTPDARSERVGRGVFLVLLLFAGVTLVVLYAWNPLDLPKASTLNTLISDSQALPVAVMAVAILRAMRRRGAGVPAPGLLLSLLLFAWGLLIVLVGIRQEGNAWVPAHYVAMIPGAVLSAFMAITSALVRGERRPAMTALSAVQPALYAGGVFVCSLALLWSALAGGERRGYFVTMPAEGPSVLLWAGGIATGLGVLAFATGVGDAVIGAARRPFGRTADSTV
ncbi:MAG: cbb3-type cytochrome c oxidase subunit I [Acidobacteria bacterium]|nr:cbb3-type cytochrome c oxidase subunit I [Acidobacteriota bacterium]